MEVNKAIRIFAAFLNESWDIVMPLLVNREYTSDDSSVGDWIQTNWEILVEKKVLKQNEYLEVYSAGADYNGVSSRMNDIDAIPTYSLIVQLNNNALDILNNETINNKVEFEFDSLVGFQNGFYIYAPPFNYALVLDEKIERVFSLDDIKFELKKI